VPVLVSCAKTTHTLPQINTNVAVAAWNTKEGKVSPKAYVCMANPLQKVINFQQLSTALQGPKIPLEIWPFQCPSNVLESNGNCINVKQLINS